MHSRSRSLSVGLENLPHFARLRSTVVSPDITAKLRVCELNVMCAPQRRVNRAIAVCSLDDVDSIAQQSIFRLLLWPVPTSVPVYTY